MLTPSAGGGLQILEMEVANIMKGKFEHFMQKEIHEQPESITQTLLGRINVTGKQRSSKVCTAPCAAPSCPCPVVCRDL